MSFLKTARLWLLLCPLLFGLLSSTLVRAAEPAAAKAPFHILYSNDLTNIVGTLSPYNPKGEAFQESMLRASVDETAGTGVDVHMLQPGLGWVPLWQSKVLPMAEHARYCESVGRKLDSNEQYVAQGGDIVKVFVEECRAKGLTPFVSMRLNDSHHIVRGLNEPDPEKREKVQAEFQYFVDHPEYRLGPDMRDPKYANLFDWAHPEVRQYRLSFLKEICQNYDIDGLELDFMRHTIFFNDHTPVPERKVIMTEFVRQVRALLDETAGPGKRRWLCVRIPGYLSDGDAMGVDLKAWAAAGIDMVNVSGYFFNDQQMEIAAIRSLLPPRVAIYDEIQFTSAVKAFPGKTPEMRRATDSELYTTAHLAYANGADGVSVFNFQYYRGTRNPKDVLGSPHEPPFHVFKHMADPVWLSRQPQDYFLGVAWGKSSPRPGRLPYDMALKTGVETKLAIDMAPPSGGWKQNGRLRIEAVGSLGDSQWKASLNGVPLEATSDVSEPYPNPYDVALGQPEDYRAWVVPSGVAKKGQNELSLTLTQGEPIRVFYVDLTMP